MKVFHETEGLLGTGKETYEPGQFVFTNFTFETVPNTSPTVKVVSSFGKPRFTGTKLVWG